MFHVGYFLWLSHAIPPICFDSTGQQIGKGLCCLNFPFEKLRKLEANSLLSEKPKTHSTIQMEELTVQTSSQGLTYSLFLCKSKDGTLLYLLCLLLDNGLSERLQCGPLCISGSAVFMFLVRLSWFVLWEELALCPYAGKQERTGLTLRWMGLSWGLVMFGLE